MNQEQNNTNQNNFNMQGNNGIPNNQPLNNLSQNSNTTQPVVDNQVLQNNQNFNNGFNQGVQQEININQPIFNSQRQSTPLYQPPIIQEPTPQPMNTFENENINNRNLNNKQPKKIKLGLVVGIGIAVVGVIIACIILVIKIFNNNSGTSINDNSFIDNIKVGNVELTMTSKNIISNYSGYYDSARNYEYFETKNDNDEFIIIDSNAKQILPIEGKELYKESSHYYNYLGNGYFIYDTYTDEGIHTAIIVKDGKFIVDLNSIIELDAFYSPQFAIGNYYKNNILYTKLDYENTIAYDVKNKKELWRSAGTFIDGYVLDDNFIRLQTAINPSGDNDSFIRDPIPNTIIDYEGNKVVSGADAKGEKESWSNDWKYDYQIYTSKSDAYLKIKENDYIKVFDLNNNLKTTISLKETDEATYRFKQLLYSGVFIVEENPKGSYGINEILYNEDGKILLTADSIDVDSYPKIMTTPYRLSKNFDLVSTSYYDNTDENACVLIKDGEAVGKYKKCERGGGYGLKDDYLLYYDSDTYKILNLKTLKEVKSPVEYTMDTNLLNQSPNGEYFTITDGKKYFVYDSEFNKKYESEHYLRFVNDKYIISLNETEGEESEETIIHLINIENGKANKLDVKGEYYAHNTQGLVTYDGINYYLYDFK